MALLRSMIILNLSKTKRLGTLEDSAASYTDSSLVLIFQNLFNMYLAPAAASINPFVVVIR
jgi:hypothetical protein